MNISSVWTKVTSAYLSLHPLKDRGMHSIAYHKSGPWNEETQETQADICENFIVVGSAHNASHVFCVKHVHKVGHNATDG
jgi:hypothetical protein